MHLPKSLEQQLDKDHTHYKFFFSIKLLKRFSFEVLSIQCSNLLIINLTFCCQDLVQELSLNVAKKGRGENNKDTWPMLPKCVALIN